MCLRQSNIYLYMYTQSRPSPLLLFGFLLYFIIYFPTLFFFRLIKIQQTKCDIRKSRPVLSGLYARKKHGRKLMEQISSPTKRFETGHIERKMGVLKLFFLFFWWRELLNLFDLCIIQNVLHTAQEGLYLYISSCAVWICSAALNNGGFDPFRVFFFFLNEFSGTSSLPFVCVN